MRQQFARRHAKNGRASAHFSINDEGRAEVRVSVALGGGRFFNYGYTVAQAEALVDAVAAALRDDPHKSSTDDRGR